MLAALMLLAAQGGDEAVTDEGDVVLADTVVTGLRTSGTVTSTAAEVTVVSGEELRDTGERSLPRAIGRTTGVWIQETNLGGGAPVIRGLLGSQVLILVDGVRVNDSTTRLGPNQSLNQIDPYIVDRVEVVRGARSLLYGSDAIGGAILIWTRGRRPATRELDSGRQQFDGTIAGIYNSGYEGGRASGTGTVATDDHGLMFVGSLHNFDDLRAGDNEEVPFTAYSGLDLFGSWEWAIDDNKTLRTVGRVHRDFDVPRTDRLIINFNQTVPANLQWNYALQDRRVFQTTYTETDRGGWADEFQARFSLRHYEELRTIQATGSDSVRGTEDKVDTVGLGIDWRKFLGTSHVLTWGLDIDNDDVDSFANTTSAGNPEAPPVQAPPPYPAASRYTRLGAFLQDEIVALDPWFFTLGARYSYYDFSFEERTTGNSTGGNFDALVFSGEAAREIEGGVTVSASLSQGFRAPNLEDLANSGNFAGGVELGNPNLEPEKSLSAEAAVAWRRPIWGGTFAAFATHIDDLISRTLLDAGDPNVAGDEVYLRSNAGEAQLYGLEASVDVKLFHETSQFSLVATGAYVRGRQTEDVTDPGTGITTEENYNFRRIPPLHGRAGLRYDGTYTRNYVDWAELYVLWALRQDHLHPQDVSDPRIDPNGTAGWATLNIDVGGPISNRATWTAGFHNILDSEYRVHASGFDAPGAALVVGVRANF